MDWSELSEKVFGLVWTERRVPTMYDAEDFAPPYDEAITILKRRGASREDVLKHINDKFINNAVASVSHLTKIGDDEGYDSALVKAAESFRLSKKLRKASDKLERNEDFDLLPIYGEITSVVAGQATGLTLGTQIDYKTYVPFIPSGWGLIDRVVGGIPADGPIIVYGRTAVGKSYWGGKMASHLLQAHPKWNGAIYTLEMSAEHYLWRTIAMFPDLEKNLGRLHVSGMVKNIEELVAEITTKRVNFVVIDDVDGLVFDVSAAEHQKVYSRIREIARFLKIPVIALAQPNRAAKLSGRFPTMYDISWSGGGENSAALLIALEKANSFDIVEEEKTFVTEEEDMWYMIFWKSREDWPKQQGPGAIILTRNHKIWCGKPYREMEKLWQPGSGRAIGKKKRKEQR